MSIQLDDDGNRARIMVERLVRQGATEAEIVAAVADVTGAAVAGGPAWPFRGRTRRRRVRFGLGGASG